MTEKIRSSALLLLLGASAAFAQPPQPGGALPGPLPLFPPDNWWNANISSAPVDPHSDDFIRLIGGNVGLHPDFGGDADTFPEVYGMIYIVVPGTQPLVPVTFVEYGDESDPGAPGRPPGYPIPNEAKTQGKWVEGGHPVHPDPGGPRRPEGGTRADAAGLAILPGLVRYEGAFGSEPIRHAFRFTVEETDGYVFP